MTVNTELVHPYCQFSWTRKTPTKEDSKIVVKTTSVTVLQSNRVQQGRLLSLRVCREQNAIPVVWCRPPYIITPPVITLSSWVNHGRGFNCKKNLHNRAEKAVGRISAKQLQRNPGWNYTFSIQLFSKVTWKYVLCMDFYHILTCSSLVLTLLRTSSVSLLYMSVAYREPG